MIKQKRSVKFWTWGCIGLLVFLMIVQMNDYTTAFQNIHFGSVFGLFPTIIRNATIIFVPMIFGAVCSRSDRSQWNNIFRYWLTAVGTLIIYYLVFWLFKPSAFNMWQVWGIIFPVSTSSSIILTTIILGLICEPYIIHFQANYSTKQNLLFLILLTLFSFIFSAGMMSFHYSASAIYLVVDFAWGIFLSKVSITKKTTRRMFVVAIVSFLALLVGSYIFGSIYWQQSLSGWKMTWNRQFVLNPLSPILVLFVISGFVVFKYVIANITDKQLRFLIIGAIIMQAPIASKFMSAFKFASKSKIYELLFLVLVFIASYCLLEILDRILPRLKFVKSTTAYLSDQNDIVLISEHALKGLKNWAKRNRVSLFTWAWFYLISMISLVIVSSHLRIQLMNRQPNVIIYVLSISSFSIILTSIFLYAIFTILYFITTRYWISNAIVTVVLLGFSIASKLKMQLRGEPIYPSDLGEATNLNSLIKMVNQKVIIVVAVALIIVIALTIFLEIKVPIKSKKSWKRRGIWALLSMLVLLTPLRFNHENSYIHYLSNGFNNNAGFANPQVATQQYGPFLNFLNFLDMQVMKQPSNYTQENMNKMMAKYAKVAKSINKDRKQKLSNQTIVFNLSESFVDPYTFPGIKISKSAPNPVKYIQQLKSNSTYGSMLSAGYGGGTANMEYESLTGLNMGLFKTSSMTPFVQIVPKHSFYPTIGMNFNYASAIHDYYGTFYSRIEDYKRFKFNKFAYMGSKYKITDQKKIDKSPYNSDYTAYQNAYKQINARQGGQFINLISMQNHMPYNNWYTNNPYSGKISGDKKIYSSAGIRTQMATFVRGVQYTDKYVHQFIQEIDKIHKPITVVFYGDHYPSILSQRLVPKYPVQMHSTRYFIYSNKYARQHGAKAKLTEKTNYVGTSDFIAMMLEQTDSKVTPYQALLTEIYKELPALTINFGGNPGYQLISQKGKLIDPKTLTVKQRKLIRDYEMIQYDMTSGNSYSLENKNFYK